MASNAPVTRRRTILVVDDHRETRVHLSKILGERGFSVETAESGSQVLDRVSRGGVDLVLLDILMPGLSGTDCCRLLKSMTTDSFLPVVLLTARTDTESRIEGLRIGADDYICKPFDERELVARVDTMLRIKQMHDDISRSKKHLEELATRDELTGLFNYRYLHSRLAEEFKRAERYRDPLTCAMLDVDQFKVINDEHGHDVGDRILSGIAKRMKATVREVDVVARYGGDELLVVLPSTHFSGGVVVAGRLWEAVRARPFVVGGEPYRVTVSIGLALFPSRDIHSKDQLLKAADKALYQAKADGRDRICVYQHQGYIYRPETEEISE